VQLHISLGRDLYERVCACDLLVNQGILDPALELAKLEKKFNEANSRAEALRTKAAVPSYQEKTPEAVKADDAEKLAKAEAEAAAAQQAMADMQKLLEDQ
jgi:valyl-tRNA synthetase